MTETAIQLINRVMDHLDPGSSSESLREALLRVRHSIGDEIAARDLVISRLRKTHAPDDPECDETEFAHPAWWRGYEHGCAALIQYANRTLDGEPIAGVSTEPWETLRRRLAAHATAAKALRDAVPVLYSAHIAGIPCATIDLAAASVAIQELRKVTP